MNRNGLKVMYKLIGLVLPLVHVMIAAITMGVIGFLTAIFIIVLGGVGLLNILGFATALSLKQVIIGIVICAVLRGILRYAEQGSNHYIAFKLLALIRHKVFIKLRKLAPAKLEGKDKELAERNKEYAMFTTATLQKLYADGVKDLAKTTVPADDLIGMAGIVNELKTNKNASVREAAVASIGYMTRPEYKKDLAPLLKEAANDQDAKVKAQATKQLNAMA